jgi:hypothetical protein
VGLGLKRLGVIRGSCGVTRCLAFLVTFFCTLTLWRFRRRERGVITCKCWKGGKLRGLSWGMRVSCGTGGWGFIIQTSRYFSPRQHG